jgi:hypothetical protein
MLVADSGDLNGDDQTDLLLFHKPSKEAYEKSCSVYLQKNGKFSVDRKVEIYLGERISVIDIKDIDSDGADELCGFDDSGAVLFELKAGLSVESRRVLDCRTLLPVSSRGLVVANWSADIDSDGRSDIVLPTVDGIRLFFNKEDSGFAESRILDLPVPASIRRNEGQIYVTYRLPVIEFSDFDKDGNTDIGVFDVEGMNYFLTDCSPTPGRHLAVPLIEKLSRDLVAGTAFPDIDANGVPDAVLVLMSQKKSIESELRIYFGSADFSYGEQPDYKYSGSMNLILPIFLDATGDGKKEMFLQNINIGINFFLNYFLANRIRVDTELYALSADGKYAKVPASKGVIHLRAGESGTEPARGLGDFNGDGLDDFAVGTAEDRLSFFLAAKENGFSRKPSFELNLAAYGSMKAVDLNADEKTDLIIIYPQAEEAGKATLLLSR